jgi:hypothetical protein
MAKGIMKPAAAKAKAAAQAVKAKQVDDTKVKAAAQAAKPTTPKLSGAAQAMADRQAQGAKTQTAKAKAPDAPPSFSLPPEMRGMMADMIKRQTGAGQQQAPTQTNTPYDMDQAAYNAMIQKAKANQGAAPTAPPNQDRLQALQGMLKGLPQGQTPPPPRMPMGGMGPRMGGMGGMGPRPPMGRPGISPRMGAVGAGMMGGMGMKKGGKVSSASSRGDGIAQRGKTKGKLV